jgi:hypothetical protein
LKEHSIYNSAGVVVVNSKVVGLAPWLQRPAVVQAVIEGKKQDFL